MVNQELIGLNEQITKASNYTESIISTIREPLLVLDKNLTIKTANTAFYKTFQVHEPETEGRSIFELGNRQWDVPQLRTLLKGVLENNSRFTDFEVRHTFPSIGERVFLLNGREMIGDLLGENLILLAMEDVTERMQHQLKEKGAFEPVSKPGDAGAGGDVHFKKSGLYRRNCQPTLFGAGWKRERFFK